MWQVSVLYKGQLIPITNDCHLSYVFPFIAYGFLGVEVTAVSAFEARDLRSLRIPSQTIAYFIFLLYLFCAIGEFLNVDWNNPDLPPLYGGINREAGTSVIPSPRSRAITVIATIQAGYKALPGFLNGCIIFSALSASNTSLYIASRTLYGMTRNVSPWQWFSWLKPIGTVWHKSGVPMLALLLSAISFFWLPFLQLKGGYAIADVLIPCSRLA